jgi:hypothetical protein
MNLLEFRAGIATYLDTAIPNTYIYTHDGEFGVKEVKRYARQTPAIVIALAGLKSQKNPVTIADVLVTAAVLTDNRPQNLKGDGVLNTATLLLRELVAVGQFWGLDDISAPKNVQMKNLYGTDLGKLGVTMWGASWHQSVDLTSDSETFDDLELIHCDYDLGPVPDGEIEAQDDIETI